jgi:transposase-like protein
MQPQLNQLQAQVLAGLLAGASVSAVARQHKIHRSTIYEWRHQNRVFAHALAEGRVLHRHLMFDAAQELASRALETLAGLLASENEAIRLKAVQTILQASVTNNEPQFAQGFDIDREQAQHANMHRAIEQAGLPAIAPAGPDPGDPANLTIQQIPADSDTVSDAPDAD